MRGHFNPFLEAQAKRMRSSMTEAEKRLWWHLRRRVIFSGGHFRRQIVIERYIVDFACISRKIIVELDGAQHGTEVHFARDVARDDFLQARGWQVLEIREQQVFTEIDCVIDTISAAVQGLCER